MVTATKPEDGWKCWAANLGGCAGGISGEHLISKGLFSGKTVQVSGHIWKSEKPKSIGINSLTANILCRTHNSALSDVDAAGIGVFRALRQFEEIHSGRQSPEESKMKHRVFGPLLERWCLKHMINLFVAGDRLGYWYDGSEASAPPPDIIEAAFGLKTLERPRGLYNFAGLTLGEYKAIADQVGFTAINLESKFAGCIFEFQALTFLIWLLDRDVSWTAVRPFYHHMGGHFDGPHGRASLIVEWPAKPA
jgi:hypothetical protein